MGSLINKFILSAEYCKYDLPDGIDLVGELALSVITSTKDDRLLVIQIADEEATRYIIHFPTAVYTCKNLKRFLLDDKRTKIFNYARFDAKILMKFLSLEFDNIFCINAAVAIKYGHDSHYIPSRDEFSFINMKKPTIKAFNYDKEKLNREEIKNAVLSVFSLHDHKENIQNRLYWSGRDDDPLSQLKFLSYGYLYATY